MSRSRHYVFRGRADEAFLRWKERRDDVRTWNESRIKGRRRNAMTRYPYGTPGISHHETRRLYPTPPRPYSGPRENPLGVPYFDLGFQQAVAMARRMAEYFGELAGVRVTPKKYYYHRQRKQCEAA